MSAPDDAALSPLLDLAARADAAFAAGLDAQLQWLEDAALALARDDAGLGDDGTRAATDFKAALGAVLHWARGPKDPATVPELEAVLRALTTRGLAAMYRALSSSLRTLADARTTQRSLCLDLAGVFTALARALEQGTAPPIDALERLAHARDALG